MRSITPTKLSLKDFGRILGINPLHLGQVVFTPSGVAPRTCDQAYFEHDWQDHDRISRESMAIAIAEAEELIERQIGYRLAPAWEVDEWRPTIRPYKPELTRLHNYDVRGYTQAVKANWGHFISGGIRSKEIIEEGAAITYTDPNSDGFFERATVIVTVDADLSPCELHIYYPDHDGDDAWEIKPIQVSIVGTTATIIFGREQAVVESELEDFYPEPVDGTDDTLFLENLDVYRVYNDPQTQVSFLWEPFGLGCQHCGSEGCSVCAYSIQTGCIHLRSDPRSSLVVPTPASWNQETLSFDSEVFSVAHQPDIVRLYYYSGLRDKRKPCTQDMDEQWKRTVAHYAVSLLDRPPCDCSVTEWAYWHEDLALVQGNNASGNQRGIYRISNRNLDNPFGTRRGQVDAWNRCLKEGIIEMAIG